MIGTDSGVANTNIVWHAGRLLALEEGHINEAPEAQRTNMRSAVKRLTFAAWQIDAAGDLGNKEKLLPLYKDFSAAVAEIQMIYGAK